MDSSTPTSITPPVSPSHSTSKFARLSSETTRSILQQPQSQLPYGTTRASKSQVSIVEPSRREIDDHSEVTQANQTQDNHSEPVMRRRMSMVWKIVDWYEEHPVAYLLDNKGSVARDHLGERVKQLYLGA
jgi:hypothetical protein